MTLKILVVGCTGLLGTEMMRSAKRRNNCHGQCYGLASNDLDITNQSLVNNYLNEYKPDIIINCAAYTKVDQAEEEPELAYQVNALGPKFLALGAEAVGAKLVHISTDYVFDGKGIWEGDQLIPYVETDATNPINVYGKTKLAGEDFVRNLCSRHFILRTAWLYGEKGPNFVKTILEAAKTKDRLQVVNDQFGCPTHAKDLAEAIWALAATEAYGLYHCTGTGSCSWFEFARKIVALSGAKAMVEPITSEQLSRKAPRPKYSVLDNQRLTQVLGKSMPHWEHSLEMFIKNMPTV